MAVHRRARNRRNEGKRQRKFSDEERKSLAASASAYRELRSSGRFRAGLNHLPNQRVQSMKTHRKFQIFHRSIRGNPAKLDFLSCLARPPIRPISKAEYRSPINRSQITVHRFQCVMIIICAPLLIFNYFPNCKISFCSLFLKYQRY